MEIAKKNSEFVGVGNLATRAALPPKTHETERFNE